MPNPRLASRYAKSLLDLAIEKKELERVQTDMLWLQKICKSNRDFVNLLRSPIIKGDTKLKIIDAVVKSSVSDLVMGFIRLLVNKGREENLPEILPAFINLYKDYKGIHTIKLTTAAPVSDTLKNAIVEHVKKTSGISNIELETSVNEDLIGGFVLQSGDKLIDASIAYDLKNVARQFENNDFIYKIR
jgi:F-type H+-transporting ATPase subunit delta